MWSGTVMWLRHFDGRWKSKKKRKKKGKIIWFSADFLFPTSGTSRIFRCIASTFPSVVRSNRCQFFHVQYFIRKFEFYTGSLQPEVLYSFVTTSDVHMSYWILTRTTTWQFRIEHLFLSCCCLVAETEAVKLNSVQSFDYIFIYLPQL